VSATAIDLIALWRIFPGESGQENGCGPGSFLVWLVLNRAKSPPSSLHSDVAAAPSNLSAFADSPM
jgi:hypothetical protein